jgi:hypothetical protein
MRLIEPTQKPQKQDQLQKVLDQFKKWLPIGKPGGGPDEAILDQFIRGLDNRYILLRNLQLEKSGQVFPPILVGPAGLAVLNISNEQGFFRIRENSWWKMNKSSHRYDPAKPNLVKQSQEYAQKLGSILDVHGKSHPEVTPLLILANPGVHIESSNPAIRIVLVDGIDNLISTLLNSEEIVPPNTINTLADSLAVMADPEKAIPMGEGEDFFGKDLYVPEKKAPPKLPSISLPSDMPLPEVDKKLQFSKKQWIILGVLLFFTILVLLAAIVFALSVV